MRKILFSVFSALAVLFVISLASCSGRSNRISGEAKDQIQKIITLKDAPTYFVDSVSKERDGIKRVQIHRKSGGDGSLDSTLTVSFYLEFTPSARYIKTGDSIKLNVTVDKSEQLVSGRYVENKNYESYLFVFVDQIDILVRKHNEKKK